MAVDYMGILNNTTSTAMLVVEIVLVLGVVSLICFIIWRQVAYNIKYRVRELTGGKTRIIDDMARLVKTQGNVIKWKLKKRRHYVPIAPPDAVHMTNKGKLSVEAYFTPEGQYKYVRDNGISPDLSANFEPVTTEDREFYVNELAESEKYRKVSIWDRLAQFAPMIALMMIFVMMLVFWEDITRPNIAMAASNAQVTKDQAEIAKIQRDTMSMLQGRQVAPEATPPGAPG
jgi:hypothetical protein